MADTLLPKCTAELEAYLADLSETLEGFYDLRGAHDITPEMTAENNLAIVDYERRRDHVQRTLNESRALATDGYPAMADRLVEQTVFTTVQDQQRTVNKAVSKYKARTEATGGKIEFLDR